MLSKVVIQVVIREDAFCEIEEGSSWQPLLCEGPTFHCSRMSKRLSSEGPTAEEPASRKARPFEPEREFKEQDTASSSSSTSSAVGVLEVDVSKACADVSKACPDLVRRASMTILSSIGASRSKPLAALSAEEEQELRTFYLHLMRKARLYTVRPTGCTVGPARANHGLSVGLGRPHEPQEPACALSPHAGPTHCALLALSGAERCWAVLPCVSSRQKREREGWGAVEGVLLRVADELRAANQLSNGDRDPGSPGGAQPQPQPQPQPQSQPQPQPLRYAASRVDM